MFDGHQARWHGWRAGSRDEQEIRFLHLRADGVEPEELCATAAPGTARPSGGIGSHPLFFAAAAVNRAVKEPPLVTGARLLRRGLPARRCSAGAPRLGDDDFTRFLRRYQLRALRTGKREAAEWAFRERDRALARTGIPDAAPEPT